MSETSMKPNTTLAGLPVRLAAFLLTLSLVGIIGYSLAWPEAPLLASDSRTYLKVAEDLKDFHLDALTLRTIGYPLFLRLTGSGLEPSRTLFVASLVAHFLAIWIFAQVLVRCGLKNRTVAALACLVALPPFVEPAAMVLTETLSQLLLLAAFSFLLLGLGGPRLRLVFVSGLLFGVAAIVRPTFQAIGPALALAVLGSGWLTGEALKASSKQLRAAVLLGVTCVAVVGGYATWSWVRFDFFGLAPGTLGYSLSTKTSKVLERLPEEYAAEREILIAGRDANLIERGSSHTGEQFLPGTKPALEEATGLRGLELEDHILHLNLLLVRAAPLHYLWESLRALPTYWFPTAGPLSSFGSPLLKVAWTALHFLLVGIFFLQCIVICGGVLLELTGRGNRSGLRSLDALLPFPEASPFLLAGAIVFYTMAISCGLHHGEARYRNPTDLLIVLMVALGAVLWKRLAVERRA